MFKILCIALLSILGLNNSSNKYYKSSKELANYLNDKEIINDHTKQDVCATFKSRFIAIKTTKDCKNEETRNGSIIIKNTREENELIRYIIFDNNEGFVENGILYYEDEGYEEEIGGLASGIYKIILDNYDDCEIVKFVTIFQTDCRETMETPCTYVARAMFSPIILKDQSILRYTIRKSINSGDCSFAKPINSMISVYNTAGHKIVSYRDIDVNRKTGQIIVDTSDWERGMYFIRMRIGDRLFTGRGFKL